MNLPSHAQLCSSFTWVNNDPSESLGFLLADAGYDVWLSNNRGNVYSTPRTTSDAFWDFTYDEMGGELAQSMAHTHSSARISSTSIPALSPSVYDLPAAINFVLHITGFSQLSYVGHS